MKKGKNVYIRPLIAEDAEASLKLQTDNRSFFEQFSMERNDEFYTIEGQKKRLQRFYENMQNDEDYYFGIFHQADDALIGTVNLFQILRGSLQSAFIGYFLDEKHNGKGYTTEAAKLMVEYSFDDLKLHRVEAGVMPRNIASIRVLEKAGFHKEGIARKNVKINGKWEDHQLLAVINPND
ncbi:GNAT family N-acetyltransferase [Bacillus swezeyi]|uniref:N-acetyltransferase n=1 Tax=Bacillus swezeyi TaxID=1925020 RepID=A0A5M8RKQ8_9BACI|nr:GNAT family protein [Bacillus swezeyi]KAA6447693.1 N-acetyltransferase [Bacillus swezeyi]TYS34276.1 GNAT family N-acetyltransferase [Bacillus swezeyi]